MDPRIRKISAAILRVLLSAGALYFVFQQLDITQLGVVLAAADPGWAFLALGAYVLSKIISALRLSAYFNCNGISLTASGNLQLYFIGMFYNLFLPGGIGGDAYKVWLLHQQAQVPVGKSVQAILFDRLSGVIALAALGFLFAWSALQGFSYNNLLIVAFLLSVPAPYLMHQLLGKQFLPITATTMMTSMAVQLVQVGCAWALLQSLHILDNTPVYLAVFLVSSLVSVLPISVGGIGLRELVFITAAGYSAISRESSVAFSLMFFVVTAVSSLPGGFISFRR